MKRLAIKYDYLLIGVVALIYYSLLCAKEWSWMFVSGDSGDWLAASSIWLVPQPYGSPLYILLGHFINLLPVDLVLGMTIGLSVIPASITVAITYLIVKKLFNVRLAIISSLVLLSSAIFLSQATILEEYAIATMFLTLAVYFYVSDKKKLTLLMLGLAGAIHIIAIAIAFLWLVLEFKNIKQWYKNFWIYFLVGIVPYGLILLLMYLPTPRLIAGDLSLGNLNSYLGSSGTIGSLSIYEAPKRILSFIQIVSISLSLGIVPFVLAFKKPWNNYTRIMIVTIVFCMWLYITNIDPSTWTFMCFAMPMMCIMIAIGLNKVKLQNEHIALVSMFAIMLIIINSFSLNANLLTQEYSQATKYEQAVKELPDNSCIVLSSGGQYGLGLIYIMSQGKDVIPIYYCGDNYENDARYQSYVNYMDSKYNIRGSNTLEQVQDAIKQGKEVYMLNTMLRPEWKDSFNLVEIDNDFFSKVTSTNQLPVFNVSK